MRIVVMVSVILTASACLGGPPAPNPDRPVDYISWMNEGFGRQIKQRADNGAIAYAQAFAAFDENDALVGRLRGQDARAWSEADTRALRTWLERNARALELVASGAGKPKCYFELKSETGACLDTMIEWLPQARGVARALALRAELRLHDGDTAGAAQDLRTLLKLAHDVESQPMLIQYLVGVAVRALGLQTLRAAPTLGPDVDVAALADAMREMPPVRSLNRALQFEEFAMLDMTQRRLKDRDGDGRYECLQLPAEMGSEAVMIAETPGSFDEACGAVEAFYAAWREVADDLPAARALAVRGGGEWAKVNPVLDVGGGDYTHIVRIRLRAAAEQNATCCVLAMHAFKAREGRWPASLEELKLDQALLMDPFSGEPLRYVLREGEPVLYSVGDDGTDDGGKFTWRENGTPDWNASADACYWPVKG
jgi:hypothetical protein